MYTREQCILISFVIFNVTDLSQLWTFLKGMFGIGVDFSNFETLYYLKKCCDDTRSSVLRDGALVEKFDRNFKERKVKNGHKWRRSIVRFSDIVTVDRGYSIQFFQSVYILQVLIMKDKLMVTLFVGVLIIFGVGNLILEDVDTSKYERRKLMTTKELKENFIDNLDKYLTDQLPFRNELISLNSVYERYVLAMMERMTSI